MQLHRERDQLAATGAGLFVIGNGAPMFIEGFRETTHYEGPIYVDPSLKVYEAAQLERGISTFFKLGAVTRTVSALRRGARQGRTQGDVTQQGGVLVIDPDGRVRYQHVSKHPGDNASTTAIVHALSVKA